MIFFFTGESWNWYVYFFLPFLSFRWTEETDCYPHSYCLVKIIVVLVMRNVIVSDESSLLKTHYMQLWYVAYITFLRKNNRVSHRWRILILNTKYKKSSKYCSSFFDLKCWEIDPTKIVVKTIFSEASIFSSLSCEIYGKTLEAVLLFQQRAGPFTGVMGIPSKKWKTSNSSNHRQMSQRKYIAI